MLSSKLKAKIGLGLALLSLMACATDLRIKGVTPLMADIAVPKHLSFESTN
jgi:hypothetical protein